MILKFPNLDTLRLALTTGAVPATVSTTAAVAGFDDQDQVWIETSASLSRTAQNELKKLGVHSVRTSGARLSAGVSCWPELLPLVADTAPLERLEQTPVLFVLANGEELAHLAAEMLRLGNDRQGYRWLEAPSRGGKEEGRALLRVVGPPYYSLLRALAPAPRQRQNRTAPVAYVERAPGVWVEMGHVHPLVDRIKPPRGKLLLLRPPRQWDVIEDAPFRDVYEAIDFQLPDSRTRWKEGDLAHRIGVTLSLRTGGAPEGAELWVLREDAVAVLDRFVQNADDQLLHRLAFAVGTKGGQTTIVLRVRQTRLPPPVLVFPEGSALGYRPYLKLPNLFLPVGSRLHPPLRRDVVRKLLADDPNQVTWLMPQARSGDGPFTPESLPEDAFRPLTDWIDYILDREKEALDAWVQAARFEFEPFICSDDPPPKPRKPPGQEKPRSDRKKSGSTSPGDKSASEKGEEVVELVPTEEEALALDEFGAVAKVEPSELQKQLDAAQERFLAVDGGLDAPERQRMWPELAGLNAALKNPEDAGLCWANALWLEHAPTAAGLAWAAAWFRVDARATPPPTWLTRLKTADGRLREVSGADLEALLKQNEPTALDVRVLAAYLIWSARRNPPPVPLLERLSSVQRFLERHERMLPVRTTWLAWTHLAQLSSGDVLALARARDRLLERLYQNGLRPEHDLPGFLRFAGQPSSQRFRAVRQWFAKLCDNAVHWTQQQQGPDSINRSNPMMEAYVNLIFAFGLARLGERDAANARLERARTMLGRQDEAHKLILQAFQHRITQALNSQTHSGPLPDALLASLEKLDRMPRYVVDQMRRHSRILEPDQHIDPYRHWNARTSDLEQQLADLTDVTDKDEVRNRVLRLYKATGKSKSGLEERARILRAGLSAAPRVGEDFGRYLLDQTLLTYDALPDAADASVLEERARFLERALFVAAHFDQMDSVQHLVSRFEKMLQGQSGPQVLQAINLLAGQCFRGLRKLGMRDEIDRLLALMAELVLEGKDVASSDLRKLPQGISALTALLHVASGWYYFNRDRQAEPILQAVRGILLENKLPPRDQKTLAVEYARTVGQAPVEVAQKRLEEIFGPLRQIFDTFTTGSHYSVHQVNVVEAVVLAVVSDDFTLGSQARRWLDDDEFLVRRRIHRDVKQQLS